MSSWAATETPPEHPPVTPLLPPPSLLFQKLQQSQKQLWQLMSSPTSTVNHHQQPPKPTKRTSLIPLTNEFRSHLHLPPEKYFSRQSFLFNGEIFGNFPTSLRSVFRRIRKVSDSLLSYLQPSSVILLKKCVVHEIQSHSSNQGFWIWFPKQTHQRSNARYETTYELATSSSTILNNWTLSTYESPVNELFTTPYIHLPYHRRYMSKSFWFLIVSCPMMSFKYT